MSFPDERKERKYTKMDTSPDTIETWQPFPCPVCGETVQLVFDRDGESAGEICPACSWEGGGPLYHDQASEDA